MILTWAQRCEYWSDGKIVTNAMIQQMMQEEIDELRQELALQKPSDIGQEIEFNEDTESYVVGQAIEQEPVGMLQEDALGRGQVFWFNKPEDNTYLYTHPMRELTDEEIMEIYDRVELYNIDEGQMYINPIEFAKALLKKASEK